MEELSACKHASVISMMLCHDKQKSLLFFFSVLRGENSNITTSWVVVSEGIWATYLGKPQRL